MIELTGTRPLTAAGLAEGAAFALSFPLGYASVGLVLNLRRPANPIGWLFATSGLLWSLWIPWDVWIGQLLRAGRPLPLAAQLAAVAGEFSWAPAIALGITLPALLPDGRLRSRRWRVVVATAVFGATVAPLAGSLMPGQLQETPAPIDNPYGLAGAAGTAASVLTLAAAAAFSPCAAGSRTWSTGASTGVATTPPAPWRGSRPGCATRSTWTPCRPSCWPWSTRPCSRPRLRCGYAHRRPHGHPGRRTTAKSTDARLSTQHPGSCRRVLLPAGAATS